MAKPVGSRCNLRCSYCYYRDKPAHGTSNPAASPSAPAAGRMDDALLELFIRSYIEASPGPEVSFVWHGGEPSLAGLAFYQRAVQLQRKYLPEGWEAWNNLQTNGVLLDDEWCSFLAESGFDVGLSIDGTQQLHDRYRQDARGQGSYQAAYEAVRRLMAQGVRPDLLCTVTSTAAEDPLGTYRALRDLDSGWIQFIPIVRRDSEGQPTPDSVSAEAYGSFLCAVFDEWAAHDFGRLEVQLFAELGRVWAGGSAGLCWMAPTCGRALIVEQDGSVYSCDHFVFPEYRIGDIRQTTLRELADSPSQQRFSVDKTAGLPKQCLECTWLDVCNGGCPKDRFALSGDGEPGLNHLCGGLARFYPYAYPLLQEAAQLRRAGLASSSIAARLGEMVDARWQGVGRNDKCVCGSGRKAKACCWYRRP